MTCNGCKAKKTCPFYGKNADECVYEVLAAAAKSSKKEFLPEWEMAGYNGNPTKVKWNYD